MKLGHRLVTLALAALLAHPGSATADTSVSNWVWYYEKVERTDADLFRNAKAVVVSRQPDEAETASLIHSSGARAYHYFNAFWLPEHRIYDGIDIARHPEWQLCGPHGSFGRVTYSPWTGKPTTWRYPDLNERGMYDAAVSYLEQLKAAGYDGLFFDRGTVIFDGPMMNARSTCTEDPVEPGATFSEAYARVIEAARAMGFRMVLNYGSPRPLPPAISTIWERLLRETPPEDDATNFAIAFARRQQEELAAAGGEPRYVEELKTQRIGDRKTAFFEWAEAALWRIDLTINAGDNDCVTAFPGTPCWHYGTFPELTRVERGDPVDAAPLHKRCDDETHCLWLRHWRHALVTVNTTDHPIRARVRIVHDGCRVLTNVWTGTALHRGACKRYHVIQVPALSGRVYTLS